MNHDGTPNDGLNMNHFAISWSTIKLLASLSPQRENPEEDKLLALKLDLTRKTLFLFFLLFITNRDEA